MSIFAEIILGNFYFTEVIALVAEQIFTHLRAFSVNSRSTAPFSLSRTCSSSSKFALIYEHFPRNPAQQRRFHQAKLAHYQANFPSFPSIFRKIPLNAAVFIKLNSLNIKQICPHIRAFSAKSRSTAPFSSSQTRSLSSKFTLIYEHFPRNPAQQRRFHQAKPAHNQANLLSYTSIFREIPLNSAVYIKPNSLIIKQISPHFRAFSAKSRPTAPFSSS